METIEMIQTKDGKLFESKEKAKDYIADKVCGVIDSKFDADFYARYPWFNKSHIMDIVCHLAGDYSKAHLLTNDINRVME